MIVPRYSALISYEICSPAMGTERPASVVGCSTVHFLGSPGHFAARISASAYVKYVLYPGIVARHENNVFTEQFFSGSSVILKEVS